jgi:hypothetical protein
VFWATDYDIFQGVNDNVLARRALAVPSLYQLYLQTLIDCAARAEERESPDSPTWLQAEIRRTFGQIRQAARDDTNKRFDNERFEDELVKVLRFASDRPKFVDHEARFALGHMRELARVSPSVLPLGNPQFFTLGFPQDTAGLRMPSVPSLGVWR